MGAPARDADDPRSQRPVQIPPGPADRPPAVRRIDQLQGQDGATPVGANDPMTVEGALQLLFRGPRLRDPRAQVVLAGRRRAQQQHRRDQ